MSPFCRDRPRRLSSVLVGASVLVILLPVANGFEPRSYNGTGNNIAHPSWGSVGSPQIRAVAGADYDDPGFTPPGSDRPTAREVMTDVFLSSTPAASTKSAMFVAWGLLLTYDLSLTVDNTSEPFNVPCDDGNGLPDVWCPLGASSDEILFNRSEAAVVDSVRNPINYATAFIDLDFLYGRSEEGANALRAFEGGLMNVTDTGVPFRTETETWLMADQRPAKFPVTFALHIMLLAEHNRCCVDVAPELGYEGDEDLYQACRAWTISVFQHVMANDFYILMLGASIADITADDQSYRRRLRNRRRLNSEDTMRGQESGGTEGTGNQNQKKWVTTAAVLGENGATEDAFLRRKLLPGMGDGKGHEASGVAWGSSPTSSRTLSTPRRLEYTENLYVNYSNPGADVFTLTAGVAALESALPATVRIVSDDYASVDDDNIELTVAIEDIAGLFERNTARNILRGAVLSPALEIDTYHAAAVSNLSPLLKLPVDAVQRGRDHGLPTYNEAREAYNLTAAADFSEVTSNAEVAALLNAAYGGDIHSLDAITGALAEDVRSAGGVFGELLYAAWAEQVTRSYEADRLYHLHTRDIENLRGTTLSEVLTRTLNMTDLPLAVFTTPSVTVCAGDCESVAEGTVTFSDSFGIAWEEVPKNMLAISLRATDIGSEGMMGIGFGGSTMFTAEDFIICVITSEEDAVCSDRSPVSTRKTPDLDDQDDPYFEVTQIVVGEEWTTVTFLREKSPVDGSDYDLGADIDDGSISTSLIYAFKEGDIGQHANANRGSGSVNFATGDSEAGCDSDTDFASLHGALMLIAWLLVAPVGIYFIRYRKGELVQLTGQEWWEMHQEIMILAAEAVLPLGITAVFASEGGHDHSHAHWGYYMIAAVATQVFTGWIRTKGLEAKHANFSSLHRFNKYFHIYSGRFAYVAGVVQCYRGLELVSDDENLLLSVGDGLDLELGSFNWIKEHVFPVWLAVISTCFVFCETRKRYRRLFDRVFMACSGCLKTVHDDGNSTEGDGSGARLMPRTEDLPIYTVKEFNDKVLNGQSWVIVDGAVLDVSRFAHRHPGGARLIVNAVGTDITHEMLGQDLSVGRAVSWAAYTHPESAWEKARALVIGYIEEEEEEEDNQTEQTLQMAATVESIEADPCIAVAPFGKAELHVGRHVRRWSNSMASRLSAMVALPDPSAPLDDPQPNAEPARGLPKRSMSSNKALMECFHVCPLLFRERMGVSSAESRDILHSNRPVYRYIFSCPGQAQELVDSMVGVGYFNMRATREGQGVIQRVFNAFAVRVVYSEPSASGRGWRKGGNVRMRTRTVVPANQTSDGTLCIEMRIRLYPDGAMSKLLEKLANDPDHPSVQLQGPFLIRKLIPPPAHRNVIMVAAGTGINPMVQQIRDYLAHNRDATPTSRSRLVLLWQNTSREDMFSLEEIAAMQAENNGLLQVTGLISGSRQKRNIPRSSVAKKAKVMLNAARHAISPTIEPSADSIIGALPSREEKTVPVDEGQESCEWFTGREGEEKRRLTRKQRSQRVTQDPDVNVELSDRARLPSLGVRIDPGRWGIGRRRAEQKLETPTARRPQEVIWPIRNVREPYGSGCSFDAPYEKFIPGLVDGKVNRTILEKSLGGNVMAAIAEYNARSALRLASSDTLTKRPRSRGRESDGGENKDDGEVDDGLTELCGGDNTAGTLQIVISGPVGFVVHVERILVEMGVPSEAMVCLD